MRVVTCPDSIDNMEPPGIPVFVGGGISNCPTWQVDIIRMLGVVDDGLILVNPRREHFDVLDAAATEVQIEWEYYHIHQASAMLFWFPKETLCPITLYELGSASAMGGKIFVGCHPEYARRVDVVKQLSLVRPSIVVRDTLEQVAQDVAEWYSPSKEWRFG